MLSYRIRVASLMVVFSASMIVLAQDDSTAGNSALGGGESFPDKYTLDYAAVERCCPPIRSTFVEVAQTIRTVRGRNFRQQMNGGYGLPVIDKVGDRHLLHVGADLGWRQIGDRFLP